MLMLGKESEEEAQRVRVLVDRGVAKATGARWKALNVQATDRFVQKSCHSPYIGSIYMGPNSLTGRHV